MKLYTTAEVANLHDVSPVTILNRANARKVGFRTGRDWFFTEEDVLLLKSGSKRGRPTGRRGTTTMNTEPLVQSIVVREKGCHPYQVVVLKAEDSPHERSKAQVMGEGHCYSTHLRILPPDREPFMVTGHYDMTFDEAMEDFHKRLKHYVGLAHIL